MKLNNTNGSLINKEEIVNKDSGNVTNDINVENNGTLNNQITINNTNATLNNKNEILNKNNGTIDNNQTI